MKKIAIVYHSGFGHTQRQAEHVAKDAREAGTQVSLIPAAEAESRFAELNASDAIIFGTSTYMGSLSAPFKAFMNSTSRLWHARAWQDKGDRLHQFRLLEQRQAQQPGQPESAARQQRRQGVGAMAESDLKTAEHLGRRVAEIALRYHRELQDLH